MNRLETPESGAAAKAPPISRATATVLPRDYYVSPDIFEREAQKIFLNHWTYAGHVSQIPTTGDYFVHEFAGESLIIVREAPDSVRAHFNVCRHRGSQLTKVDRGNVKRFLCPYHHWNYDLNGALKRAPMMPNVECIDYDKLSLMPAAVEIWAGMIFVNLNPRPDKSLAQILGPPPAGLLKLEPENIKEVACDKLVVEANWKTLLENYDECYHCAGSHPELIIAFDMQASMQQTASEWVGLGFIGGEPMKKDSETLSMTGELISKPLGRHAVESPLTLAVAEGLGLFPVLTRVLFHVDHAIIHTMNPLSAGEVLWTSRWYVRGDAVEGVDYHVKSLTAVWRATNAEDKELCERNYRGVLSRKFIPGPLNPVAEGAIRPMLDMYLEMMK